jgi:hypothetical protein
MKPLSGMFWLNSENRSTQSELTPRFCIYSLSFPLSGFFSDPNYFWIRCGIFRADVLRLRSNFHSGIDTPLSNHSVENSLSITES